MRETAFDSEDKHSQRLAALPTPKTCHHQAVTRGIRKCEATMKVAQYDLWRNDPTTNQIHNKCVQTYDMNRYYIILAKKRGWRFRRAQSEKRWLDVATHSAPTANVGQTSLYNETTDYLTKDRRTQLHSKKLNDWTNDTCEGPWPFMFTKSHCLNWWHPNKQINFTPGWNLDHHFEKDNGIN